MDRKRNVNSRSGNRQNPRRREPDSIRKKRKRSPENIEDVRRKDPRKHQKEHRRRPAYIDDEVFERSGFNDIENKNSRVVNKKSIDKEDSNISNKASKHNKKLTFKNIKRGLLVLIGIIIIYNLYIF